MNGLEMLFFSSAKCLFFCVCADPTSGVSIDWVRGIFNTTYTYAWELRDTGTYGFLLPASQIIDTAEETFNSVVVILQHAKDNPPRI
jgi:carboxypeptidase A4